jgi:hypothetical protein
MEEMLKCMQRYSHLVPNAHGNAGALHRSLYKYEEDMRKTNSAVIRSARAIWGSRSPHTCTWTPYFFWKSILRLSAWFAGGVSLPTCVDPSRFPQFSFFQFSSFNKFYFAQVISITRLLQKKFCTQLVREKLYTQVIFQTIMYTSCMHKLCALSTWCLNLSDKNLYFAFMRQSCAYKFQKWKDKPDVWKSYEYNIFQKVVPTRCMYNVQTSVKIVLKNYAHNLLLQNNFYV